MALPWPFLGAGLKVLPKPGAWMKQVNRLFGAAVLCFAAWYVYLAYRGFAGAEETSDASLGAVNATLDTFESHLSVLERPVLVDCWASWCKNCAAMERTTFRSPEVVQALAGYDVRKIEIQDFTDLARHPELAGLDIKGLPAYVVWDAPKAAEKGK